jgi:hypothetical protein
MRPKTIALLIVLTLMVTPVVVLADVPYDDGPWSAIDSGYAVTTNHHGEDVPIPPFPPLVAQVGLLAVHFPYLEYVRVDLRDEDENVVDSAYLYPGDFIANEFSPQGEPIMYALTKETGTDDEVLAPDTWEAPMHYSVKAHFFMDEEYGKPNPLVAEAMRAVTVMTIPEVPLGTLTVLLTMLATLGFLARKKL